MSQETHSCPKCGKSIEEGFILERDKNKYVPGIWVEGAPEPSFWTFTKVLRKTKRVVVTYRCVGCGYLESYANRIWNGKVKPG